MNWLLIPCVVLLAMILVYKISLVFWPDEHPDPWDEEGLKEWMNINRWASEGQPE